MTHSRCEKDRGALSKIISLVAFVFLSLLGCDKHEPTSTPKSKSELQSTLDITPVDSELPDLLGAAFSKQISVFGINVLATQDTPDSKLQHAANVLAQYLDNDEDGEPDNRLVVTAMQKNKATLVMFATERDASRVIEDMEDAGEEGSDILESMILQDLYGEETHPNGAARGIFDASYEEVLHLVTHAGYASAYPEVFGERPGTKLGDAMDKARGGRFLEIPASYPEQAWYSYYDETCDYGCQATEYIYWGLTSLLGAQNFSGRGDEIADEWRLNTPEKFKTGDLLLYNLLTDKQYRFATRLPDGNYRPTGVSRALSR